VAERLRRRQNGRHRKRQKVAEVAERAEGEKMAEKHR
jgi:hypothetical protein